MLGVRRLAKHIKLSCQLNIIKGMKVEMNHKRLIMIDLRFIHRK